MGNSQAREAAMMTATVDIVAVEVPQDFSYDQLQDQRLRDWAMAAAGTIRSNISGAVQKVLEAGHLLQQAKERLPHGEYLPWVQQACGLKPDYAARLIKAADWASNVEHVPHLDTVPDATTLFLLSADTTPEEVREWFMERCAAGDVPSRAEVQERKRSAGRPRQPQPAEAMALAILRKGELDRIRQALQLAERASTVSAAEVMAEQHLRELGKLRFIPGAAADFHRTKDGTWIRLPHAGDVDVSAVKAPAAQMPERVQEPLPEQLLEPEQQSWEAAPLLSLQAAADRLGMKKPYLNYLLCPTSAQKRDGAPLVRNGFKIAREGRGMVRLTPV
jgi:hypothetical protein